MHAGYTWVGISVPVRLTDVFRTMCVRHAKSQDGDIDRS